MGFTLGHLSLSPLAGLGDHEPSSLGWRPGLIIWRAFGA